MTLNIVSVTKDTAALWGQIHNRVIPASPLSEDDVRERMNRHQLSLAYVDGLVVGNATLRPPTSGSRTATAIVRVLPEHRGRGYGTVYARWILSRVMALDTDRIETVVLQPTSPASVSPNTWVSRSSTGTPWGRATRSTSTCGSPPRRTSPDAARGGGCLP